MNRSTELVPASAEYLARIYGLGWGLGALRELVLIPRIGRLAATAAEATVMVGAISLAARHATRRLGDRPPLSSRIALGALAFAGFVPLELLGVRLRRIGLRDYLNSFATPAGAISAAAFAWFALAPAASGNCSSHADG
ncbi:MAG: hypothetical protein JO225_00630 [Candidatus Eremiobacteraeota bacterium]|nr:hypothetical protein [Candidatus Eremiobacteraeota bacterium]